MTPFAALQMYDWPEAAAQTDALWAHLRHALRAEGFSAPQALTRGGDVHAQWRDPALMLGQSCGYPFSIGLCGDAVLLGSPDYGVEGCDPGCYRSLIIVRPDSDARAPDDLRGRRLAYNAIESQSGFRCLGAMLGEGAFPAGLHTGSHRASIRAVAAGEADCAAIDGVSWRLAERHEPAARNVRILGLTPPTPGLPLICAPRFAADVSRLQAILAAALGDCPQNDTGIRGFARFRAEDYAALADAPSPLVAIPQ